MDHQFKRETAGGALFPKDTVSAPSRSAVQVARFIEVERPPSEANYTTRFWDGQKNRALSHTLTRSRSAKAGYGF